MGQPSRQIILFEVGAFHSEKLPLFGGVHPAGKPQTPPDTRTFNAAFADGHVKAVRQSCLGNWERYPGFIPANLRKDECR